MHVRACVRAFVRACVRACACVRVDAFVPTCVVRTRQHLDEPSRGSILRCNKKD